VSDVGYRDGDLARPASVRREAQRGCRERYPNLSATFNRLVQTYERFPWTVKVDVPGIEKPVKVMISGGMLLQWAVSPGTHLAAEVPAAIDALAHGEPQPIAIGWARGRVGPAASASSVKGFFYGVSCSEWVPFETEAAVVKSGRRMFPAFPDSVLRNAPNLPFMRRTATSGTCRALQTPSGRSNVARYQRSLCRRSKMARRRHPSAATPEAGPLTACE